jgi:hypothetical protein
LRSTLTGDWDSGGGAEGDQVNCVVAEDLSTPVARPMQMQSADRAALSLLLGLTMLMCPRVDAAENVGANQSTGLKATMLTSPESDARPSLSLEFCNHGQTAVAIPKPSFPNHWTVITRHTEQSLIKSDECSGGVAQGAPDPGFPNRYDLSEYRSLNPGECYTSLEDLDFLLTTCSDTVVPGEYDVTLVYAYSPTADEATIPIVTGPLTSNTLHVTVTASAKAVGQGAVRSDPVKPSP